MGVRLLTAMHARHVVVDMKDLEELSLRAAKEKIKQEIKSAVTSCPQQSMVIIDSAELIRGERVHLLDVLLDPLNRDRPFLDDVACSGLLVLLLMGTEIPASSHWDWRASLEELWEYKGNLLLSQVICQLTSYALQVKVLRHQL
jgi:hypothetical protein